MAGARNGAGEMYIFRHDVQLDKYLSLWISRCLNCSPVTVFSPIFPSEINAGVRRMDLTLQACKESSFKSVDLDLKVNSRQKAEYTVKLITY